MTIIDTIGLVFLGFLFLKGLIKGFISEILGIVILILAIFLSISFYSYLTPVLEKLTFIPSVLAPMMAYLLMFMGIYIAGQILMKIISHFSENIAMGLFGRFLGGLVGFMKGAVFISVLIYLLYLILPAPEYKKIIDKNMVFLACEPVLPSFIRLIKSNDEGTHTVSWQENMSKLKKRLDTTDSLFKDLSNPENAPRIKKSTRKKLNERKRELEELKDQIPQGD